MATVWNNKQSRCLFRIQYISHKCIPVSYKSTWIIILTLVGILNYSEFYPIQSAILNDVWDSIDYNKIYNQSDVYITMFKCQLVRILTAVIKTSLHWRIKWNILDAILFHSLLYSTYMFLSPLTCLDWYCCIWLWCWNNTCH